MRSCPIEYLEARVPPCVVVCDLVAESVRMHVCVIIYVVRGGRMECVVRARDWRCGVRISKKADGRDVRREAAQNCGICAIFRMDSSGGVGFVDVARSIIDGAKTEETRCAVDAFLLAVTVREGGCTWQELGRSAASLPPSRGNVWSPPGHHQGTTVGIPSRSEELDWGAHRLQHVPGRLDTPSPV